MANRKEEKAKAEINVIRACRDNYVEKCNEVCEKLSAVASEIALCEERIRTGVNEIEQEGLINQILDLEDIQEILIMQRDNFGGIISTFKKLINLLEQFMLQEQYKYVIKTIPEKELPKMVKDPKRIQDVLNLVTNLLKTFHEAWQRQDLAREQHSQKEKQIKDVTKKWKEVHTDPRAEEKAKRLAKIKGEDKREESVAEDKREEVETEEKSKKKYS